LNWIGSNDFIRTGSFLHSNHCALFCSDLVQHDPERADEDRPLPRDSYLRGSNGGVWYVVTGNLWASLTLSLLKYSAGRGVLLS
jgi:hypothetical protein